MARADQHEAVLQDGRCDTDGQRRAASGSLSLPLDLSLLVAVTATYFPKGDLRGGQFMADIGIKRAA